MAVPSDAATAKAIRKAERKAERKAARKAERAAAKQAPGDDEAFNAKLKRKAEKAARRKEEATTSFNFSQSAAAEEVAAPPAKRAKKVDSAAAAFLAAHELTIHDDAAPPPCLSLAEAPFPPALVQLLTSQPFTAPSPVQAASWPIAVSGRDVLAIAKTGSGKTLGFLLPVLSRCVAERPSAKGSPLAIIMAPTRELALQIHDEATKFGRCVGCTSVAVYGGAGRTGQVAALARGCELIVGTPGRIKDVLDVRGGGASSCVKFGSMCMLVLDEADRMLDMGFERDIRSIVWQCFGDGTHGYRPHQTYLYSATWPVEVQGIASDLLSPNAVKVTVGSGGMQKRRARACALWTTMDHAHTPWDPSMTWQVRSSLRARASSSACMWLTHSSAGRPLPL
jgi:ATP-dependent RNA helicase DDX5/DBP2